MNRAMKCLYVGGERLSLWNEAKSNLESATAELLSMLKDVGQENLVRVRTIRRNVLMARRVMEMVEQPDTKPDLSPVPYDDDLPPVTGDGPPDPDRYQHSDIGGPDESETADAADGQ